MKDTPIFILVKDRLTCLKKLLDKLAEQSYQNLHLIDTGSTYEPMLEFQKGLSIPIHRCEPKGPPKFALWSCGILVQTGYANKFYVLTDCDVIPDCPADWMKILYKALNKFKQFTKAGLGLRIDDIPDCYSRKKAVIAWERKFWKNSVGREVYRAPVDTTLALYRPGTRYTLKAVRIGGKYQARHLPWYQDSAHPTAEDLYYKAHLQPEAMAFWTRGVHPLTLVR